MSIILDHQNSDDDEFKRPRKFLHDPAKEEFVIRESHYEGDTPPEFYPFSSPKWSPFWYWSDIPIPLCDLILNTCKKVKEEEYDPSGVIKGHDSDINFRQSDIVFRQVEWVNSLLYGYIHKAKNLPIQLV